MAFRKIQSGLVQGSVDNFIGKKGTIFYDNDDGSLRISDGSTPGGSVIGAGAGGYTLPTASTTTKGGVKVDGTTITINNQIISAVQQDLSSYATQTYVTTRGYLTSVGTISYNDLSNKPTLFSGSYNDLADKPNLAGTYTFNVAADDSTLRTIGSEETIKFVGAGGITTASDAEGKITITQGTTSSLVNGANTLSLGSTGILTFPNGALTVTDNEIQGNTFGATGTIITKTVDINGNDYTNANGSFGFLNFGADGNIQNVKAGWTATFASGATRTVSLDAWQPLGTYWNISFDSGYTWSSGDVMPVTFSSPDYVAGTDPEITLTAGTESWTFSETGSLTFPDATVQSTAWTGIADYNNLINKPGTYTFNVAADDSTMREISSEETIKFIGAGGITTASDAEGNITITGPNLSSYATETYVTSRGYITGLSYNDLTDKPNLAGTYTFNVAADDSTLRTIGSEETIKFVGAGGITTASDAEGSITITQGAAASITNGTNTLKIVAAPSSLTGAVGDAVGDVAFDSSYIYYCTTAYVSNSYTGTFSNSEGGTNANQLRISNNWNPLALTPGYGWTVTFNPGGGNITRTVSSVNVWSDNYPNGYWNLILTSSWTGTVTLGDSFTITSPDPLPTIWKRTPWNAITNTFTFNVAADDSTLREISTDETVKFVGGGGITTASDAEGAITITQGAAAAGTLTGSTLASGVTASSLTSLGTLSGLTVGGTGGDLTMTGGAITGVGNITAAGILAVNASGGITTNQTAFDIVNSTATTVNIGGAATAVNIGAITGTLTVNNPTVVGSQTSLTLFNTTATTVSAFGAATTATIGATSGTLTLRNPTVVGTQTTVNLWNTASTTVNAFGAAISLNLGASTGTTTVNNNLSMASGKTIGTTGTVTSNHETAFSAGDSAISNVALSVPRDAAIRDRTNGASTMYFDVSNGGTTNGTFTFRSSSAYTNLLTMSSTVFTVNTGAVVTARTASIGRLPFNSAIDTELSIDDYRFRVTSTTGIFPQIISNVSGQTKNSAWTAVGAISGQAVNQVGSTGNLVPNNAWVNLYDSHGMDYSGDTVTVTLQDKALGRIYRVTFMRSDQGTVGYNIIAERLL